jgi:hypothetical protein
MDNAMFSGFANVNLPKDANMIPENAQVMVMMPAPALTAEQTLKNLKNILVGVFLILVVCIIIFLYFNLQKEKNRYEGQVLPGITVDVPVAQKPMFVAEKPLAMPLPPLVKFEEPLERTPEEDIVHIVGEIPTWADDDMSDEIDKKVSETDEAIISKLKSREAFIKDLGENVAAMAKTAPIEKI